MFQFDLSTIAWTSLPTHGTPPQARWEHGFASIDGFIYVFAGASTEWGRGAHSLHITNFEPLRAIKSTYWPLSWIVNFVFDVFLRVQIISMTCINSTRENKAGQTWQWGMESRHLQDGVSDLHHMATNCSCSAAHATQATLSYPVVSTRPMLLRIRLNKRPHQMARSAKPSPARLSSD